MGVAGEVGVLETPSRGVGLPSPRVPSLGVPRQGVSRIPSPEGPRHKTLLLYNYSLSDLYSIVIIHNILKTLY